ncbi:MAG: hypothetical protein KJ622_05650 [Alphaproteobacteria bacterium]|nr:hypothetical protein [Alphaproteobacteria bacterium]
MAFPEKKIATQALANQAMATVRTWQSGRTDGLECPICSAPGVIITDRSARPHMSWFIFNCAACGLDEALAIPSGSHATDHES